MREAARCSRPSLRACAATLTQSARLLHLPWTTSPVEGQISRLKMLTRTMQADLDIWIASYNEQRAHQGRWCYGKTPMQTFVDTTPLAREKMLNAA